MVFAAYRKYDGLGLAQLVQQHDITPLELVDEAIRRIERVNPKINAVVFTAIEDARAAAKSALPNGPFRGVPFLLKDIFATARGMPTRLGSAFVPPVLSDRDCYLTASFKSAGLIPLGKTNVPEFGLVPTTEPKLYGPARNPFNPAHSAGGSSGGSAAAVAAGIVPLAHANDGGGSIRFPAAACGLVGLKPSRGRVSVGPDAAELADGLAAEGVVTRSVRDTAAALDAIVGNVSGDPYWAPQQKGSYLEAIRRPPERLRVAFSISKLNGEQLHPDCVDAVEHAAQLCESLGHIVHEATPRFEKEALVPAFLTLWNANLAATIDGLAKLFGKTPSEDQFEGYTWGVYRAGKTLSASDYLNAKASMNALSRECARFHETYDVWINATLGMPPVALGTFDMNKTDPMEQFDMLFGYVPYTCFQNVTGQPAINLPLSWNAQGLPIGVQFVGAFGAEELLLQLAAQLESNWPWAKHYEDIDL
jgi:amidase